MIASASWRRGAAQQLGTGRQVRAGASKAQEEMVAACLDVVSRTTAWAEVDADFRAKNCPRRAWSTPSSLDEHFLVSDHVARPLKALITHLGVYSTVDLLCSAAELRRKALQCASALYGRARRPARHFQRAATDPTATQAPTSRLRADPHSEPRGPLRGRDGFSAAAKTCSVPTKCVLRQLWVFATKRSRSWRSRRSFEPGFWTARTQRTR